MARPFLYDFRRTITSGAVLAVVIITVVLSLAFIPFLRGATISTSIPSSQIAALDYFDNSTGFNLLGYSFNQFGQPISGVPITVIVTSGGISHNSTQNTNSSGLLHISIKIPPDLSGQGTVLLTLGSSPGGISQTGAPLPSLNGQVQTFQSNVGPVTDASDPSKIDVNVFFSGVDGTRPSGYGVYYQVFQPNGGQVVQSGNESTMTLLGQLNDYHSIYVFPSNLNISSQDNINIAIFNSTGYLLTSFGSGGASFESHTQALKEEAPRIESFATAFVGGLLGLFVPLMAILASYSTYGKDRVSGVLESVLARPVTRFGLATSRYCSTILALVAAVVLTMISLDAVVYFTVGVTLSSSFLAITSTALSVEAAAFVGIVFLLSRIIRSAGALVGLGVGLWAILDFFWALIQFLIAYLLGIQFGSQPFYRILVDSNFFNPAQFYGLIGTYLTNSLVGGAFTFGGFQLNPADYSLTPVTLVIAGLLWVGLPFAGFLYLAVRKD